MRHFNLKIVVVFSLLVVGLDAHLYSRVLRRRDNSAPSSDSINSAASNNSFTVLGTRQLSDGTRHETIQEHANQLPPLPALEYDEEAIGNVDSEGNVLVPVDEEGNVLPGYEHLVRPNVYQMKLEDIEKMNNTHLERPEVPKEAEIIPPAQKEIAPYPPAVADSGKIDEKDEFALDYDESIVPEKRLPSAQDYEQSREVDPDVQKADRQNEALVVPSKDEEADDEQEQPKVEEELLRSEEQEDLKLKKLQQEIVDQVNQPDNQETEKEIIKEDVSRIEQQAGVEREREEQQGKDMESDEEAANESVDEAIIDGTEMRPADPVPRKGVDGEARLLSDSWEAKEEEEEPTRNIVRGDLMGKRRNKPDSAGHHFVLTVIVSTLLILV